MHTYACNECNDAQGGVPCVQPNCIVPPTRCLMSLAPDAPWQIDDGRVVPCREDLVYVEGVLTRRRV